MSSRSLLVLLALLCVGTVALPSDGEASVISVSWNSSELVSVDPYTGDVLAHHGQLDPNQNFVGLARDPSQNVLYAAAQSTQNLYRVDGTTGEIVHLGAISGAGPNYGVTSLAYDDVNHILLATLFDSDWPYHEDYSSVLVALDVNDASVLSTVDLGRYFVGDLAYNKYDGLFYAQSGDYASGRSFNEQIVTIDPTTGQLTELFPSRDVVSGFAFLPGGAEMIAWVNEVTHHFAEVDLASGSFTTLGSSDPSGISVSGMIYKDFDFYEVVPEPSTALLFGVGLLALLASRPSPSSELPTRVN